MKYIANLSGGKDSLFMTDEIIERNLPLDYVVMFDTEMEFGATYRAIDAIKPKIEDYGAKLVILKNDTHWLEDMLLRTVNEGTPEEHFGYEWCGNGKCRWRTSQKVDIINGFLSRIGEYKQYVGIAYDEPGRIKKENYKEYPLVDWNVTEKECLEECWKRGYNWNEPSPVTESGHIDLYKILKRVSCWCCANKNLEELYNIYYYLPQYWKKLEALQSRIDRPFRRNGKTIFDLAERFYWQSQQMKIEDFIK